MQIVYLIRHGQSTSNAGFRTVHPRTIELTELGLEQARRISQVFPHAPSLIVHSPYIRTLLTAQATVERFPGTPVEEWEVQEFTPLAHSKWDGTTVEERIPMAREYWERADPHYRDGEGAESFVGLMARVDRIMEKILLRSEGTLAIFSHAQFGRCMIWKMLNPLAEASPDGMRRLRAFSTGLAFPNAAIWKIEIRDNTLWHGGISISHLAPELLTH